MPSDGADTAASADKRVLQPRRVLQPERSVGERDSRTRALRISGPLLYPD